MRKPRLNTTTRTFTLLAICIALPSVGAAATPERQEARAYERDDGWLLYRETHWRYRDDDGNRRLVLYRCPDSVAFARKRVLESPSAIAPDFDFVDARDGYNEGVRSRDGRREVYLRERTDAPLRSQALTVPADAVIDAGFDAMVRARWDALGSGADVRLPFLLPSRFDFATVKLGGASDGNDGGVRIRRMRMHLDRWYGFIVPPVELVYSASDRRLLEFAGIGTTRDARGRHQNVRIVFADNGAAPATLPEIRQAASTPLTRKCASQP